MLEAQDLERNELAYLSRNRPWVGKGDVEAGAYAIWPVSGMGALYLVHLYSS